MDDALIVAIYVMIDDTMKLLEHRSHCLAGLSDAEVLTVAVLAALYFGNHHERAAGQLVGSAYVPRAISPSRFNRRLHALADWLELFLDTLGDLVVRGQAAVCDVVIDACRCRCAAAGGRGVAARCAGGHTAATAPPRRRNSSAGACTWSARHRASRSPARCSPRATTISPPSANSSMACRPTPGSTPTRPTTAPPTKRASWTTRTCGSCRSARTTWPEHGGRARWFAHVP